jgi:hypothetical protein
MLAELIPSCPRLHPGAVVSDDCQQGGREWVCRICGTRLYEIDGATATEARVSQEQPVNENTGNHSGKPRNNRHHYKYSNDQGGRGGSGGKWYE